ncbi:MAG: hypothetical protein ABI036_18295 [Fibrobacteria bacterium]
MSHFLDRVETALKDEDLKTALGRATERLGSRRSASLASLADSDLIRDMARRAKLGCSATWPGTSRSSRKT